MVSGRCTYWGLRIDKTRAGYAPLLGHHEDALDQEALEDLGRNALEQGKGALVLHDKPHHLAKALERLSFPGGRRPGL